MVLRESVHVGLASVFIFGIYYDLFVMEMPEVIHLRHSASGGRLKYLTFWNMLIQTSFFTLSLVNDVVVRVSGVPSSENNRGKLQRTLDYVFAALAFPISIFVCTCFWAIYTFDRELIFPRFFDAFFPSWLNHLMHTVIGPAVLVEMALVRHVYPSAKYGFAGTLSLLAAYLVWIHVIAYVWDFWTYPVLEALNLWQRILFFVACVPIVAVFYFLGDFIYGAVWGKKAHGRKEKKKSKAKKKKSA